jgi:protein involved in polysaccharide export with SLBB domain
VSTTDLVDRRSCVAHRVGFRIVVALCLSLSALACATERFETRKIEAPAEDTTMGPGDVFDVRVYNEKELSGKHRVAPDGTIRFPFLGIMSVVGKDPQTFSDEIAAELKKRGYLTDAHVSIFLEESHSKRVSVLGAVARPGTQPIVPGMTLIQAVSQAGGFSPLANKDETVVTRRLGTKLERYRVTVTAIARGNADDFSLRAGDIIFVPERVF